MSRIKNVFRGKGGFTLIELLIVIVIIGILAAIAIPNIADLTGTADRGAVVSNLRTLQTEMEAEHAGGTDWEDIMDVDEGSGEGIEDLGAFQSLDGELDGVSDEGGDFTDLSDIGDDNDSRTLGYGWYNDDDDHSEYVVGVEWEDDDYIFITREGLQEETTGGAIDAYDD